MAGRRTMGLWMATALVVGNMVGSGVFLLPASLAPLGWNALPGWIITIAGGLCLALVFARLAATFPDGGGAYVYVERAFGPLAGFIVAWSYWVSMWVGNAAIAVGVVSALGIFFPVVSHGAGMPAITACAVIWLLTGVNIIGVRAAGGVQLVTTILRIVALGAVIVLAASLIGSDAVQLPPLAADSFDGQAIVAATTLTLWAMLGLESATVPSDKVEDPARTIPRATLIGTAIAGAIYLFAMTSMALLMPADMAAQSGAPVIDFMASIWGEGAGRALALAALIGGFGTLTGWIMLQGELPLTLARQGMFPAWFAQESRFGTPARAHLVASALLTILTLMNFSRSLIGLYQVIALIATCASLVLYLICALAAIRMRGRVGPGTWFLVVASLAALYALFSFYGAGRDALAWGLVLLLSGLPVHWLTQAARKRKTGP